MRNKILTILLTIVMLFTMVTPVLAAELQDDEGHIFAEKMDVSYSNPVYSGGGSSREGSTTVTLTFTLSNNDTIEKTETISKINITTTKNYTYDIECNKVAVTITVTATGKNGSLSITGVSASMTGNALNSGIHTYDSEVATEATCVDTGIMTYTSLICSYGYTEEIDLDLNNHIGEISESVIEVATCTEDGEAAYTCSACENTSTNPIAATGHVDDEGTVEKEATCAEKGVMAYTCAVCEDSYTRSIAKTKDHVGGEGEETKSATCTEDGEMTYVCSVCNDSYVEAIPASHTEETVTIASTCKAKGKITVTCKECKEKLSTEEIAIDSTNHVGETYKEVVTPSTCEVGGEMGIYCADCKALLNTTNQDAKGHRWGEWQETTAATCEGKGEETRVCKNDSTHTETKPIEALGHKKTTKTVEPTCIKEGSINEICETCEKEFSNTVLEATGHKEVTDTVAATCTANGYTKVTCSVCDTKISNTVLNKLGHDFLNLIDHKDATCSDGYDVYQCSRCEATDTEVLKATGEHVWVEGATTAPTCTKDGYTVYTCSECQETENRDITGKLGHNLDTVVVDATCVADGSKTTTCSRCDYRNVVTLEKLAHTEVMNTVPATCTADGYAKVTCEKCKEEISNTVLKATGHKWNNGTTTPATCTAEGVTTYDCTACDGTKTDTIKIDPNNHGETYTEEISAATCTKAGEMGTYCKDCEKLLGTTVLEATGHNEVIETVEATDDNDGYIKVTCDVCDELLSNTVLKNQEDASNESSSKGKKKSSAPVVTIVSEDTPLAGYVGSENPFEDINELDWFFDYVMYAYTNDLMVGTEPMLFSPNVSTTRGMLINILYRLEGSPEVDRLANPFTDVAAGTWYADAVLWGLENGIVMGNGNGKFDPNGSITREQLAAILTRYVDFTELTLPEKCDYQLFNDEASIDGYAKEAIERLFSAEIIAGKPGNVFDPKGTATRAEVAAMLMRFNEATVLATE
ncbi:MAG: S-layer homology domain-containing protein [Clostridiales bacterium]|nr:S-layer homology domain-containing protein [Clostridiales bacterium]